MRIDLKNVGFTNSPMPVLTQHYWNRKVKCHYDQKKKKRERVKIKRNRGRRKEKERNSR